MSTPLDELTNQLAGIEDDGARTPEQLGEQAAEDEAIEGEVVDENLEIADEEERAAAEKPEPEDTPPPKHVPVAELVAERKRRQELEARLEALEQQRQQAQQPQQPQQPEPPKEPEDPEPDYLDDPKAWTDWKVRQQAKQIEELNQKLTQGTQVQQADMAERQLQARLQQSESAFLAENPDYYQALNHARQRVFQDAKADAELMGIQASDEQIVQYVMQQEKQIAAQLVARGVDPARYVYEIARRRYGYTPQQQADLSTQNVPTPSSGQTRPTAADQARDALRGLPSGDTGLQPENDSGNLPPEFAAALSERFGRRRG